MELLDTRCSECRLKYCQCSNCQKADSRIRIDARKKAKAAKKQTAAPKFDLTPSPVSPVLAVAPTLSPTPSPADGTKKASRSLAKSFDVAHPDPTAVVDVSSTAESPDIAPRVAKKISLRRVLKSSPHNWTFEKIPRDGHCLFHSFVLALANLNIPSRPKTHQELRKACAKELSKLKGIIPGLREEAQVFRGGKTSYQDIRGVESRLITVKEYCSLLRDNMYGGLEEIQLIVHMYKVQVFVYSTAVGTTSENPLPLPILMDNNFPPDHEKNAGNATASAR